MERSRRRERLDEHLSATNGVLVTRRERDHRNELLREVEQRLDLVALLADGLCVLTLLYTTLETGDASQGDLSQRIVEQAKTDAIAAGFRVRTDSATEEEIEQVMPGLTDVVLLVERRRVINLEYAEVSGSPAAPTGRIATRAGLS